jgi:type 1 glutamine amidotransferase
MAAKRFSNGKRREARGVVVALVAVLCSASSAAWGRQVHAAAASPKRIVFLVTAEPSNYGAEKTIPGFARRLHERHGHECIVIEGEGPLEGLRFPGLERLEQADLLVVFLRRSALSPEQFALIRGHLAAGKPLVGLRTANHAFSVRGDPAPGYEKWWDFVPEVLGCENRGYGKEPDGVAVAVAPGRAEDPLLADVAPLPWRSEGALYLVKPLVDASAHVLLTGSGGEHADEPVAWTRMAGNSRVFYTSLGYPSDFELPQFRQLLENGIAWSLEQGSSPPAATPSATEALETLPRIPPKSPRRRWPLSRSPRATASSRWPPNRWCTRRSRSISTRAVAAMASR